ncbi:microsomal glutathione S-transferase 1-like [Glandiceps talaboti]
MSGIFNFENDVFRSYLACSTVAVLKMMAFAPLTAYYRKRDKAFANPEDAKRHKAEMKTSQQVERVRRCHRNDLENIPAFLALGAMYLAINPDPTIAVWHFRIFAASRIFYTVGYLSAISPIRGINFVLGTIVNWSMAGQILYSVCTYAK